ncbi:unnamed protein product [Rhizophagus irregularis]|nr:unnamed protein product [Rhizophagus irregularis]
MRFLKVCRDEVVGLTPFVNDWWYLDDFWVSQFLNAARKQLEKEKRCVSFPGWILLDSGIFSSHVKLERKGKGSSTYWKEVIEELFDNDSNDREITLHSNEFVNKVYFKKSEK